MSTRLNAFSCSEKIDAEIAATNKAEEHVFVWIVGVDIVFEHFEIRVLQAGDGSADAWFVEEDAAGIDDEAPLP